MLTGLDCERYASSLFLRSHADLTFSGCAFYKHGESDFVWRFPVAFQIVPLIFLFCILWFFPESPRWLVKVGRDEEARYILQRLRGIDDEGTAEIEYQDIRNIADMEKEAGKVNSYFHMFWDVMPKKIGGGSTGHLHIGRRVQLVIWLQILQEWIGIAGVTVCKYFLLPAPYETLIDNDLQTRTTSLPSPGTLRTKHVGSQVLTTSFTVCVICGHAYFTLPSSADNTTVLDFDRGVDSRQTRSSCDSLLGLRRHGYFHVLIWRSCPSCARQSGESRCIRSSSRILHLRLHSRLRCYLADSALALPG